MKKLLIVVDMQNDFIDGSLGSPQAQNIVENVSKKINKYMSNDDEIIFTRDTHFNNYLDTHEGKILPVKHCIENTRGWEISNVLNTANANIWDKNTFGSIKLAEFIQKRSDISEIEIVGLCTDICVVSNAVILKAYVPEIKITVDSGCCAGVTEESHNAALLTMKMCHINIV